jgi:hypothetical protein
MDALAKRITELEQCLAPFAKLGGPLGFQTERDNREAVIATLAGQVTVGDFRRAAAALPSPPRPAPQYIGAKPIDSQDH